MYINKLFIDSTLERNHISLLLVLSLLALIGFGSFCYDNDPFDNDDLPDFTCQYPSISSKHIDQVSLINVLNEPTAFSLVFRNARLSRSPPV